MKHRHKNHFPNHENLMNVLVQIYNTFFWKYVLASDYCIWITNWRKTFYLLKTDVASEYFYHTDHAVIFACPENMKPEWYPVEASQNGSAWHISCCNVSIYNKCKSISDYFHLIHNSWRSKLKNWYKSNKTKSVSTFTINNSSNQLFEARRAWKSKHVSVYLWLQGWSACKWEYKLFERTSSKWDVMISTIFAKFYLCWYLASWKALSCYHYSLKIFETFLQLEVPSLLLSLQKSRFPLSFAL